MAIQLLVRLPQLLHNFLYHGAPSLISFELPLLNKVVFGNLLKIPSPLLSDILFLHAEEIEPAETFFDHSGQDFSIFGENLGFSEPAAVACKALHC